jgi:hypothetical protein
MVSSLMDLSLAKKTDETSKNIKVKEERWVVHEDIAI